MSNKPTPKKDAISALVTAMAGQENVIAVNRFFVDLTGTLEAAILLSQIIYWSDRTTMADGWFAKSYDDWQKEICLSKYQVTKSVKVLEAFGVETKTKKFNGAPTVHYRLKMDVLHQSIVKFLTNDSEETSQSITETTAETTKDSTPSGVSLPEPQETPSPEETAKSENKAIGDLIKVWLEEQSIIDSKAYSKTGYRSIAKDLHRAGVTPDDLKGFLTYYNAQGFWKDKAIPWSYVQANIQKWKELQSKPPEKTQHDIAMERAAKGLPYVFG